MTPPDKKSWHLLIHGRVQGVGYRESLRRTAEALAVTGWCRNRSDGTVEALVQGEAAAVDELLRWAQRGPPLAEVAHIEITPGSGDYTGFAVRETL